jgi:hypothetical protein
MRSMFRRRDREEPVHDEPVEGREAVEAQEGGPRGSRTREAVQTRADRPRGARAREAGAAAASAVGSGVLAIARLVRVVASLIALLIALAIVLRDVDANAANTIVKGVHEGANFFASPFTGLITFSGHPKRAITVDWGIALIVYLIVGAVIANYIGRIGQGGVRFERGRRALPR